MTTARPGGPLIIRLRWTPRGTRWELAAILGGARGGEPQLIATSVAVYRSALRVYRAGWAACEPPRMGRAAKPSQHSSPTTSIYVTYGAVGRRSVVFQPRSLVWPVSQVGNNEVNRVIYELKKAQTA